MHWADHTLLAMFDMFATVLNVAALTHAVHNVTNAGVLQGRSVGLPRAIGAAKARMAAMAYHEGRFAWRSPAARCFQ
jgi:hypothetical protein